MEQLHFLSISSIIVNGSISYMIAAVLGERNNKVRQYLEQLIGSLVRANLNDVPLTPLSKDAECKSTLSAQFREINFAQKLKFWENFWGCFKENIRKI